MMKKANSSWFQVWPVSQVSPGIPIVRQYWRLIKPSFGPHSGPSRSNIPFFVFSWNYIVWREQWRRWKNCVNIFEYLGFPSKVRSDIQRLLLHVFDGKVYKISKSYNGARIQVQGSYEFRYKVRKYRMASNTRLTKLIDYWLIFSTPIPKVVLHCPSLNWNSRRFCQQYLLFLTSRKVTKEADTRDEVNMSKKKKTKNKKKWTIYLHGSTKYWR